jgi:hypothetical protein
MSTRTSNAAFALGLLSVAAASAACVEALPPATTLSSAPVAAAAGESLVTFVRPESACDTGEYAVVVDARGHFVGNIAAGTQVSFATAPGTHAFYAWSNTDLHIDKDPSFNPVSAIRLDALPVGATYVLVDIPAPCSPRATFELRHVGAAEVAGPDFTDLVAKARTVSVDRAAGQVALESQPVHLQARLEFGAARLRRADDAEAKKVRFDALQSEDSTF